MNAPLTRTPALATLTLAQAYDTLARRVAFVWLVAISGDVLEAARNAVTPLALVPYATEADALRCFTDALTHRRDLREPGFARLLDSQIAFLAGVAVQLWMAHRAEVGSRETLPPPYSPMTDYSACTEDASCRCATCEAEAESRHARSYYGSPDVPDGYESDCRDYEPEWEER